uniref:Uncharacterized protein n=1 Tax=Rhipicephalus zambeziensis TaxID=60191 RepID=A0A224YHR9_9ACAR
MAVLPILATSSSHSSRSNSNSGEAAHTSVAAAATGTKGTGEPPGRSRRDSSGRGVPTKGDPRGSHLARGAEDGAPGADSGAASAEEASAVEGAFAAAGVVQGEGQGATDGCVSFGASPLASSVSSSQLWMVPK